MFQVAEITAKWEGKKYAARVLTMPKENNYDCARRTEFMQNKKKENGEEEGTRVRICMPTK